jgi:hypothetical protein
MDARNVTLGDGARAACARLGIDESAIKDSRVGSVSIQEGREYLIVDGVLPDGRRVRMKCQYDREHHIVSFRPL